MPVVEELSDHFEATACTDHVAGIHCPLSREIEIKGERGEREGERGEREEREREGWEVEWSV